MRGYGDTMKSEMWRANQRSTIADDGGPSLPAPEKNAEVAFASRGVGAVVSGYVHLVVCEPLGVF